MTCASGEEHLRVVVARLSIRRSVMFPFGRRWRRDHRMLLATRDLDRRDPMLSETSVHSLLSIAGRRTLEPPSSTHHSAMVQLQLISVDYDQVKGCLSSLYWLNRIHSHNC